MHDSFHYRKIASTVILFFIFFFAFLWASDIRATYGASITGDEPFYLLTTKSLISDQDLDLQNQYQNHDYEEFSIMKMVFGNNLFLYQMGPY